jgi:hypothetical protein
LPLSFDPGNQNPSALIILVLFRTRKQHFAKWVRWLRTRLPQAKNFNAAPSPIGGARARCKTHRLRAIRYPNEGTVMGCGKTCRG